jgi:tartrate dehydratase beta subunit/fumarate hydratase class I family protein
MFGTIGFRVRDRLEGGNVIGRKLTVRDMVHHRRCKKTARGEEDYVDYPNAQVAHAGLASLLDFRLLRFQFRTDLRL